MRILLFICMLMPFSYAFSQTSKMEGDISIKSNNVDKGISQSNKGPSVGTGFGYTFGQGKIAADAASVSYPNEGANVRLGFFGEYKFEFSKTSGLKIRNDWVRYFQDGQRNKVVISLDFNFSVWRVIALREDNFEGTKSGRNWFGLHRDFGMGSLVFEATLGYSQVPSPYENYFDTRAALTYPKSNFAVSLAHTYNSKSAQFNGLADMAFALILKVNF